MTFEKISDTECVYTTKESQHHFDMDNMVNICNLYEKINKEILDVVKEENQELYTKLDTMLTNLKVLYLIGALDD